MMPLGHAEAHERLADLALEPGALDQIGPPDGDPLAAHIVTCESCRAEIEEWKQTQARLDEARGTGPSRLDLADLATDDPITTPPALRGAILRAVRTAPVPVPAGPEPPPLPLPGARRAFRIPGARRLLPLVAVLAVVAVGAGLAIDQAARLDRAHQQTAALESVAATVDRVLRDPNHRVVDLRGADGVVRGSLSWSSHDLVVLTTALEPPPPDRVYRCWIERDGERSPVGKMWFAGATAFWNGTLDEWATTSFEAGGTFGVSLEPISGPVGNPAVLVADLPG
jgi:hypothetical protein